MESADIFDVYRRLAEGKDGRPRKDAIVVQKSECRPISATIYPGMFYELEPAPKVKSIPWYKQ